MTRPLSLAPSSWIAAARYDDDTRTLEFDFVNGDSGSATNVPPEIALALEQAPSPGRFWRRHMGRFSFA